MVKISLEKISSIGFYLCQFLKSNKKWDGIGKNQDLGDLVKKLESPGKNGQVDKYVVSMT